MALDVRHARCEPERQARWGRFLYSPELTSTACRTARLSRGAAVSASQRVAARRAYLSETAAKRSEDLWPFGMLSRSRLRPARPLSLPAPSRRCRRSRSTKKAASSTGCSEAWTITTRLLSHLKRRVSGGKTTQEASASIGGVG